MHSIRFKITAIALVALLTSAMVVFLASFSTIQGETDVRSVETMNLLAEDTSRSLEKYTEDIEQSVEMISSIAAETLDSVLLVKVGVAGSEAGQVERTPEQTSQLNAYLAEYMGAIQSIAAIVSSHTHGVVTYFYCINPDISTSERGFYYSRLGKTGFARQAPINVQELVPDETEEGNWYVTAVKRGRPSWLGPYEFDGMQICSYVVPIYKAGAFIGVFGMDIPVETLVDQVSSIRVYETGFACLLDSEGRVLYHPELESGSIPELPVEAGLLQQEDSGDALIRYTAQGQERQMCFTTLSNGMKLAIAAPTAEINASKSKLMRVILPSTLLIIAVFVVIILLFMRYVTNPLLRLTDASQRLANADYDVELDYKGKDEVGKLTMAFKRMRDELEGNIENLRRKAQTDDLTGLSNQRHFLGLADKERDRLIDEGKLPVMLYFNLIGMKHFNRQYDFEEGDRLICAVANVLVHHFGELNASRFGQDHFAVITDDERLTAYLKVVFEECERLNDGKTLPISVGIYQYKLGLVGASAACDRAKYACDQRRGSYVSGFSYFDMGMQKKAELVRYIVDHLDQAIEEKWVTAYFQPIVRAANGKVCDEEALARWNDPVRGLLCPADFVSALENAGLIYKLDLHMLKEVLEKINQQKAAGLYVVPHSINLSRSDFDACDMVDEVCALVDEAGVARDRITIEITESIIGSDFDFMKKQIERFQALGFPVWMDDFGSGYSSLDVLQSVNFDLIKFDMSFMRKLDEGENGKIVLADLMKMATSLGMDTVCEGVETEEQVRFLQEIGCSKLQGYYYCKPISKAQVFERIEKGIAIGFENPDESEYYEAIGKVNLYDLAAIASKGDDDVRGSFNTLPMAVMELKGDKVEYVRTNPSYREFMKRYFSFNIFEKTMSFTAFPADTGSLFMNRVRKCCENGGRDLIDERMPDGSIVHSFVRLLRTNPVTGTSAVAVAVVSISEPDEGATYASIARALAMDYYSIYYVDMETEQFIEYSSPVGGEELAVERRGEDFFAASSRDIKVRIYEEDRDELLAKFTKENLARELDEYGVFTATYRLLVADNPLYVTMKVTRMEREAKHVIVGISVNENQGALMS